MAVTKTRYTRGIILTPDDVGVESIEGELKVALTAQKLQVYVGAALRNVVTENQSQSLTNKTIVVASNTITTAASGNLAATELNAALAELQGSIDTSDGALATHIADTSTHGITSTIVGISESQTLTNKTIVVASNTVTTAASGNLAATELNAALAELQTDIDTRATTVALDAHINDATDAHDASAISSVPAGNLAATDVQGALNELQTDVDTRATSADLSAHIADTSTHGTTGNIVGTTDTQTLTNKTITSPIITGADFRTPSRSDVKQDTLANLQTYASTASNGQLAFATDTKQMFQVVDSALVAVGSGAGGYSSIFSLDASEQLSDWSTGDNATFLGGGTLSGTFAKDSSTPLQGSASYLYTQAAGSLNDYLACPAKAVDVRFRGAQATLVFPYTYDGANNDIQVIFYDVTNAAIIPSSVYIQASTAVGIFKTNITIPSTCASIRIGFQTAVLNSGKIFEFDSVELTSDSTTYAYISNDTDWTSAGLTTADFTGFGTVSGIEIQSRREAGDLLYRGKFTSGTSTGVEARVNLKLNGTTLTSVGTTSLPTIQIAGYGVLSVADAAQYVPLIEPSVSYLTFGTQAGATAGITKKLGNTMLNSGQSYIFFARVPINGWSASNSNILTAPDTFSTDTAPLVYASSATYTLATLANAPVGTFISWTYAINTNTRTQTTTAPTQTTADMAINGIQLFSRAYNAASTSGSPSVIAIQIGKGLKGVSKNLYKSTSKTTSGELDFAVVGSTVQQGLNQQSYNESTGILLLDAGFCELSSITTNSFRFTDVTTQTNGYLTINASKNPALTGLNVGLVYSESAGNAGQAITANVTDIAFINISDTNGAWNGTQYTVPETGVYTISSCSGFTGAAARFIQLYVNGTISKTLNTAVSNTAHAAFYSGRFTKGQVLSLRSTGAGTLSNSTTDHYLTITKTNVG